MEKLQLRNWKDSINWLLLNCVTGEKLAEFDDIDSACLKAIELSVNLKFKVDHVNREHKIIWMRDLNSK